MEITAPGGVGATVEVPEIEDLAKAASIFGDGDGGPAIFAGGANGKIILYDSAQALGVIVGDHGDIAGLADDDHTQYALLAGRSGGQSLIGGLDASDNLTLTSTANATKGKILFGTSAYNELNNRLGIGTTSPAVELEISTFATGQAEFRLSTYNDGVSNTSTICFVKSHTDTQGSNVATIDTEILGRIDFSGVDSGNNTPEVSSRIDIKQNGASGAKIPSEMRFFTSDDTVGVTKRMVIDKDGNISIDAGFLQFADISAPSNPSAGEGRLYKKTGNDGIFWLPDAAGPEVDLTALGGTIIQDADGDTKVEVERTVDEDIIHFRAEGADVFFIQAPGGINPQLIIPGAGTASNPSISLSGGNGFFFVGNRPAIAAGSAKCMEWNNLSGVPRSLVQSGTAAAPPYTFIDETNTGISNPSSDTLAISASGIEVARFKAPAGANPQVLIQDGTAALPSLAGVNDDNTGSSFPGSDVYVFSTAGVERMRIDASGKLGIEEISPDTALEIGANAGGTDLGGITLNELSTDIAAPAANKVALYSKDNGSGKTQIIARFNTGAVQVLATQP